MITEQRDLTILSSETECGEVDATLRPSEPSFDSVLGDQGVYAFSDASDALSCTYNDTRDIGENVYLTQLSSVVKKLGNEIPSIRV
jgi:hypothetical protein